VAKPSAYLETTVVSVLTARPTRDVVQTAWQQITREWWEDRRAGFELFISLQVFAEAARRRLAMLNGLPELAITAEVERLAGMLAASLDLPPKKRADSVHIAVCAVHGVKFLITWNCTHLANPVLEAAARKVCHLHDLTCPMIVTPYQLNEMRL
jgi:hypothetical protein